MNATITPTEHSDVVGGSTAARTIACPASVKLVQKVKLAHKERILDTLKRESGLSPSLSIENASPETLAAVEEIYREETSNPYTKEGTSLHEAIAWILENDEEGTSVVDREFEGTYITISLYNQCIIPALEAFDEYLDRVYEEDGEDLEFQIEQRGEVPGVPGAFGTSDVIGRTSKRMAVIDWKFGNGLVDAKENDQLMFYARALAHTKQDWLTHPDFGADKEGQLPNNYQVDLVIIQPKRNDKPKVWSTTYGEIEAFRLRLIHAVSEALSDNPKAKRGKHCKFCDAKHICPAMQQVGERIMGRVNSAVDNHDADLDYEDLDAVQEAIKEHDVQFTQDDLDQWVRDAEESQLWIDHVMKLAFTEAKAGRGPKSKKLIRGAKHEIYTEEYSVVDRRLGALGISVNDRRVTKSITPAAARKKLKGDDKLIARLEKITTKPEGDLKLVDVGAKGEPVKPAPIVLDTVKKKLVRMEEL